MKKFAMLWLTALCLMTAGCGPARNTEQNEDWIEKSAALVEDDVRSGKFVLNGEVYTFPMKLSDWLEHGWHISENLRNKDKFVLQPHSISSEFELFNEKNNYVSVAVYNDSEKSSKLEECMVYQLRILIPSFQIVLPSGINHKSRPMDVRNAYGEPDYTADTDSIYQPYYDFEQDGWLCSAMLQIAENPTGSDSFVRVMYLIRQGELASDLDESAVNEMSCARYLDATMKAAYHGDYEDYIAMGIDTEVGATELYHSEVYHCAEFLMEFAGVDIEELDEETTAAFDEIAAQVLSGVSWEVAGLELNSRTLTGNVTLMLHPADFVGRVKEDVAALDAGEEDRVARVLEIFGEQVQEAGSAGTAVKKYSIDCADGILSADVWDEIDDVIIGKRD